MQVPFLSIPAARGSDTPKVGGPGHVAGGLPGVRLPEPTWGGEDPDRLVGEGGGGTGYTALRSHP